MSEKISPTLESTVQTMADSLIEEADRQRKSLRGITIKNFNCFLDDLLDITGEIRCEKFADLSWPYAENFGVLGSDAFQNAQWRCIEAAIAEINRRLEDNNHERPH